jgi:hypothetical protein
LLDHEEKTLTSDAPVLPQGRRRTQSDYPLGGIHIGPAWRAVWQVLSEAPGPVWLGHLAPIGAAAGAASPETVKLVLDKFRKAGILRSEKEMINSRWQLIYWRADQGEKSGVGTVDRQWLAEWCQRKGDRLLGAELP